MGFSDSWHGTPPTSSVSGYTPWIKSPGYDFSSALYSYMMGMIGKPAPSYRGPSASSIANNQQSMAPEMSALMQLGRRYMDTGMPTTFGTGISSLGRFLAPSFSNPYARLQMGAPNYFGQQAVPPQFPPGGGGMMGGPPQMGGMPPQQGGMPPQQLAPPRQPQQNFNFFRQYGG